MSDHHGVVNHTGTGPPWSDGARIYIFEVVQHDTFGSRIVEKNQEQKTPLLGEKLGADFTEVYQSIVQLFLPFWRGGKAGLPSNILTGFFSTTGAEGEGLLLLISKSGGKLWELANFTDSDFTGEASHW